MEASDSASRIMPKWLSWGLVVALGLLCLNCEPKKGFDYWQYVEWEEPSGDDHMDMDGGADGGDDGGDMDMDMEEEDEGE